MAYRRAITGFVLIGALATAPVFAKDDDGQRRRGGSDRQGDRTAQQAPRGDARGRDRAVPRSQNQGRQNDNVQRQNQAPRQNDNAQRQNQAPGQNDNAQRQYQAQRQNDNGRQYQAQRQNDYAQRQNQAQRQYAVPRNNSVGRDYQRPYYSNRGGYGYGYGSRAPRIIRPSIVTIVPYRPYVYRPRFGVGVYYGAGGSYPYGYTPRGYYDPLPGRFYGGLRITGAPHEAQVFADGYYVGIVDDFDGVFQHVNLEAGAHQIEIRVPGYEPIAFDVVVQPGRTTTFRADVY